MLLQGVLLGISLSFLVGPLMFAIVEAGIGQGFRAGIAVAGGIWTSDVIYVFLALYGVDAMEALVALPHFRMWAGICGGLLLTAFGLGTYWKSKGEVHIPGSLQTSNQPKKLPERTYLWWWLRGFLVNTINPGTVFFWLGIVTAVVVPSGWNKHQMLIFFGGMLGTLIITDTLKAWAAKRLRRFLTPEHIRKIQRILGLLMILFGLVLIGRTFLTR